MLQLPRALQRPMGILTHGARGRGACFSLNMVIAKKGSLKGHRKGALGRTSAVPLVHSFVIVSGCTVNDCKKIDQ